VEFSVPSTSSSEEETETLRLGERLVALGWGEREVVLGKELVLGRAEREDFGVRGATGRSKTGERIRECW
jgi:hypothetical protein